jgi:hypothetical protein
MKIIYFQRDRGELRTSSCLSPKNAEKKNAEKKQDQPDRLVLFFLDFFFRKKLLACGGLCATQVCQRRP